MTYECWSLAAANALAVRAIKLELATQEAAWLLSVRARLRKGPATTRELAEAAEVPAGRYYGRFRNLLLKAPCIARAGERLGPTGHVNIVWSPVGEVAR